MEKVDTYPLITVVIPTYNRAALVIRAIDSVLSQTYSNLELLIADDGSADKTKEAVLSINDPRIRFLELAHTGHIGKVRNAGVKAGKGEWVAFLDSDDTWLPRKLELQVNALKETARRWCYGRFELVDDSGKMIPAKAGTFRPVSGQVTAQLLTNEVAVVICTLLVERNLFEESGGFSTDERLYFRGDYEFALRLSLKEEVVALPDLLVNIFDHPGRITNTLENAHERSSVPYRMFLETQTDPRLRKIARQRLAYLLAEAAVKRSAAGDHRIAWTQLRKAMGNDNWRHWISALYRSCKAYFPVPGPLLKTTPQN